MSKKKEIVIVKLNQPELEKEKKNLINKHTGCKWSDTTVEFEEEGTIFLYRFVKVELNIFNGVPYGGCDEMHLEDFIKEVDRQLEMLYNRLPDHESARIRKIIAENKEVDDKEAPPTQNQPRNDEKDGNSNAGFFGGRNS